MFTLYESTRFDTISFLVFHVCRFYYYYIYRELALLCDSTYLDSGFSEFGALGEFLSSVNVGVLGTIEGLFQLVHLLGRESCAMTALLLFQRKTRLRIAV